MWEGATDVPDVEGAAGDRLRKVDGDLDEEGATHDAYEEGAVEDLGKAGKTNEAVRE